jgi:hypothetical protein
MLNIEAIGNSANVMQKAKIHGNHGVRSHDHFADFEPSQGNP